MHTVAIMLAASVVTVDYGWEKADDGELEYIIQIEPALLKRLEEGEDITSQIDPRVAQIRRFRVRVGHAPVPRELPITADAVGARPIDVPNAQARVALDPLATGPNLGDEATGAGLPAWSAIPPSEDEQHESDSDAGFGLAPDPANQAEQAIRQPDNDRTLDARFDLAPSDDLGPLQADPDVPLGGDRQFSRIDPWGDEGRGSGETDRVHDEQDRSEDNALRSNIENKKLGEVTPAEHYGQADSFASSPLVRTVRDSQDPSLEDRSGQVAAAGLDASFGGGRQTPSGYDPTVQNTAAGEEINRRADQHDLLEHPDRQVRVAQANTVHQTQGDSGPATAPAPESASNTPAPTGPTRRWLPFLFTLVALFASCGLNVYLGWITWDTYCRYQRLVVEQHRANVPRGST